MPSATNPHRGAVVITGASTGIGQTTALYLDQLGYQVFAGVRRQSDADHLQNLASPNLTALLLDVTDMATVVAARAVVEARIVPGELRALVNNAGIAVSGPLEFLPLDAFERQLAVNVTGLLAVTQAFLPLLRPGQGRVINIGSIAGRLATPMVGPYATSKFAVAGLTDALRLELTPWQMPVVLIEPGAVKTPIWQKSKDRAQEMLRRLPAEGETLYGPAIEQAFRAAAAAEQQGIPAQAVADAVLHALSAPSPKTHYVIGQDARLQGRLARFVPPRQRDALILKGMRMPGANQTQISPPVRRWVGLALALGAVTGIALRLLNRNPR